MTFEDFKKELLDYKPVSLIACSYCGANPKNPIWSELKDVFSCNNCSVDIMGEGEWIGYGWQYLSELLKKFPDDKRWKIIYENFFSDAEEHEITEELSESPDE